MGTGREKTKPHVTVLVGTLGTQNLSLALQQVCSRVSFPSNVLDVPHTDTSMSLS